ncbi:MAG: LysR family transcriptional regulator [Sphaerochaetaceae bacterium]
MDLKQLEYIVEIAKERNITKAARNLSITQSALTQQLKKLEQELETPIFFRARNNWQLTPTGEIYIRKATEILRIKKDAYAMIYDEIKSQRGTLSVGFSPGRGVNMFANIYPDFHMYNPQIKVTPYECLVSKQQQLILNGDLDIGFVSLRENQMLPGLRYTKLYTEDILLITPANHPKLSEFSSPLDLHMFRDESFVLISKDSSMRPIVDELFKDAGFSPNVLFETNQNITILTMVQNSVCCAIIGKYYLINPIPNICAFEIAQHPSWNHYACYRSNSYLSEPAKKFLEGAQKYWTDISSA